MSEKLFPEFERDLNFLIREAEFACEDGHDALRDPLDRVRERLGHWQPGFAKACRAGRRNEEEE